MLTNRKMNDNGSFETVPKSQSVSQAHHSSYKEQKGNIKIPQEYASIQSSSYFRIDKTNEQFIVLDADGNDLVPFAISHVIKTLVSIHPESEAFYPDVIISPEQEEVIKRLIFDYSNKKPYYSLKGMKESVFMRDVNILIMFNNYLSNFEKVQMGKFMRLVKSKSNKDKIKKIINNFIYDLLAHTLFLLSTASERIKLNPDMKNLKDNIANYVTGTVYRVSKFVHEENNTLNSKAVQINNNLLSLEKSRKLLHEKIDKLIMKIEAVEDLEKRSDKKLIGGNVTESSRSSRSSNSLGVTEKTEKNYKSNYYDDSSSTEEYIDSTNIESVSTYEEIDSHDTKDNNDDSSQFSAIYDV